MELESARRPALRVEEAQAAAVDSATILQPGETCYTLLGVRPDGVASVVDLIAASDLPVVRRRAQFLLREHQSCHLVEVWRDGAMVDQLSR
jgi:hypothetical protein